MTRLHVFLVIAIIASALFLVHNHHQARRSFMALEAATKEATRLELSTSACKWSVVHRPLPFELNKLPSSNCRCVWSRQALRNMSNSPQR